MSIGMILLIVVAVLVFMGLGQTVLDRLRLSDKAAIGIIIAIALSTIFIPNIEINEMVSINIGGFVIPVGLAIYLLVKVETSKERNRAIIGSLVAGGVIYIVQRYLLPAEPEALPIDPNYVYPVIGAIIAYALGRSRRGAFVAGVLGIVITDLIQLILNAVNNIPAPTQFGGAGGVDTTVITGILAVLIAEIFGETREKLQGGTEKKELHFDKGHFVSSLGENTKKTEEKPDEIRGDENEDK